MKKLQIRFFALCMALMLTVPLLARPAKAAEAESYEGVPLFLVKLTSPKGNVSALTAFLAFDPETDSTFLLGSSVIYDLVQNGYSAELIGSDYKYPIIPMAKKNGLTYLYAERLEKTPGFTMGQYSGSKAVAMYYNVSSDGDIDFVQEDYDLSSGWDQTSDGFLVYTGHKNECDSMIGGPIFSTDGENILLLGSISINADSEIMLIPISPGQLSTDYCIGTFGDNASSDGDSSDDTSSDGSTPAQEPDDSSEEPADEKKSSIPWIVVLAAAAILGYLIYRSNTKKKNAGPKEGTVSLEPSDSGPINVDHLGDTTPVQDNYGPTAPLSQWQLRGLSGTTSGKAFPIGARVRIGRSSQCEIAFPENTPGVSGTHCEVTLEGDRVILRDLNSTYGTYLGANNRLEAHRSYELHMGDTFTLAQNGPAFRLEKMGASEEEYGPAVRDLAGRIYRADAGGRLSFGRSSGNQVRIGADDPSVSGSHCVLYREAGRLYLMDLGSTNGTFFSQQERLKPNTPYRIRQGMAFFLSSTKNTFVVTEE